MSKIDLKGRPFYLNEEQIKWVEETRNGMTIEEKIGQLFFMLGFSDKEEDLVQIVQGMKPGGMMYRPSVKDAVASAHTILQRESKIPMFLAANLERGGNGLISDVGTNFGTPLSIAATDEVDYAYRLGLVCGREARAVGGNMAFAPVIDINYNWRNPITNVRSYGDDPARVAKMGAAYVRGAIDGDICVTIKHFPGDGVDELDHHLVKSTNKLPYDKWLATFGNAYKESIEAGARGLMVGHISLPDYVQTIKPDASEEEKNMPATLSPYLINKLLREELGYNGLTMTDATLMTGFGQNGKRRDLVPASIAAGNDMFLFTRNPMDDYMYMMEGYQKGVITDERLDEALTRILALKASLKLNEQSLEELVPNNFADVNVAEHQQWSKEIADKSVTLVRDTQNLLPITPDEQKRVGIVYIGNDEMNHKVGGEPTVKTEDIFAKKLEAHGFEAKFLPFGDLMETMQNMMMPLDEWSAQYDVIVYLVKKEVMSNQTTLRPEFKAMGFDAPWFIHEVPTLLVSLASPYNDLDFPMVQTVVDAYTANEVNMDAIIEKITGKSEFKGISPIQRDYKNI